jgi:subtilase family serine protease
MDQRETPSSVSLAMRSLPRISLLSTVASVYKVKLSEVFENLPAEEVETPVGVEVVQKGVNFEVRKVSFVILFVYLFVAVIFGIVVSILSFVRGKSGKELKEH